MKTSFNKYMLDLQMNQHTIKVSCYLDYEHHLLTNLNTNEAKELIDFLNSWLSSEHSDTKTKED